MRDDYYHLTQSCIREKDNMADDYHNKVNYYFLDNDIEIKLNYAKEMNDVKKLQKLKKDIR